MLSMIYCIFTACFMSTAFCIPCCVVTLSRNFLANRSLRALGYDLPMADDGEREPEFEAVLDALDPNRDGFVTLQEYMAYMISKETDKVSSSEDIENAFRAITTDEREFVTKAELYHHLSRPMADYCMKKMKPYTDPKTNSTVEDAYDFVEFTNKIFQK